MKKILISLSVIGLVGGLMIGATIAYFNDTETSTDNIFVAGELDLKVDHAFASYNGTNSELVVVSDTNNIVVETGNNAVATWAHHPAWTANIPGATWIWKTYYVENPTQDEIYTFRKKFTWNGTVSSATLDLATDNSHKVYLNGTLVAQGFDSFRNTTQKQYNVTGAIRQGENILDIEVKNWALANSTPQTNPAGLLYKLRINSLWEEKDLEDEKFFNLEDVKPGDYGRHVISLHVDDNDAWLCLFVHHKEDKENNRVDPEIQAGDITDDPNGGELSQFLNVFGWTDNDKDGVYEPFSPDNETPLFEKSLAASFIDLRVADSTTGTPVTGGTTKYVGLAWCAGNQTINHTTGVIVCDGSAMTDVSQTDSLIADLTAYAEQYRGNPNLDCSKVSLP